MNYYSICFIIHSLSTVPSFGRLWSLFWHKDVLITRVKRHTRVVALVQARSEDEAVEKLCASHPVLFISSYHDVISVESPESWEDVPDQTFKHGPNYDTFVVWSRGKEDEVYMRDEYGAIGDAVRHDCFNFMPCF